MKLTQIALALVAISAAPAFADHIAGHPSTTDITLGGTIPVIYISGASALSGTFGTAVGALCTPGQLDKYVDNKDNKQTAAYLCKNALAASGFGTGVDKFIAVKRDEDGSFAGVGPVLQKGYNANGIDARHSASPAGGLNFMDLKKCTAVAPLTCVYTQPFTTGGSIPGLIVPDAGLSDVETKIWQGRGQFPFPAPAPAPAVATFKSGFAAQGFGIAVTEELYKAMQTKALADGDLEAPCVVGDFTAACQPSISRAQYTSIVSDTGGYHTDWSPIIGAAGQAVNLCRRVATSGTQASSDVYFLSNPCANANPTFGKLTPAGQINSELGLFHVTENSSTGNVKNCLNYHNNGFDNTSTTSYTNGNGVTIPNNEATEGKFAIGVVSLENLPAAGTGPIVSGPANAVAAGDKWKFIELSDVSPNLDVNHRQTAIDGDYDFAFEFEALWRNDIGAARITFMNALVNELGNPGGVNLRGIYTVPGTFDNATFPTLVGKGSRFGNSCQPLQLF